jgi:hypothetical protein
VNYCQTHKSIEPACIDCITRFHCEQRDKLEAERDKLKARVEKLEKALKYLIFCSETATYTHCGLCVGKAKAALEQGEGG